MGRRWQPLTISETAELLRDASFPWWICGGWSIDLFLGRQTREHADVEVGVLRRDQCAVFAALEHFEIHSARDGTLTELTASQRRTGLTKPNHGFWCRPRGREPWALEILLNEGDDDDWIFRRDAAIRRSLEAVVCKTEDGVPYLAPEVQLLFKAKALRPRDQQDFESALPKLSAGARAWLADALQQVHPGHPWSLHLA